MDIRTYGKIKCFCIANLFSQSIRDRHLEDCTQFVAMGYFESGERKPWKWLVADYCRQNGIGARGASTAKTIEISLSIDAPSLEMDNSYYLLDEESILRSECEEKLINNEELKAGIVEEFLLPLKFNTEVLKWIKKSFRVKMN